MKVLGLPAGILTRIALRNLLAHKAKTLIVGAIVLFGTALVVVGNSLLDSVNTSMSQSIVGSLAGHIQVYSKDAKDELALFGGMMMGSGDVGVIEDFSVVKDSLAPVDNIRAIVPMGVDGSVVFLGNSIDLRLEALRRAVSSEDRARIEAEKQAVRLIVELLEIDLKRLRELARADVVKDEELADVQRASTDAFWAEFDRDPLTALEFLENRIAPQAMDDTMVYLRYLGTDLTAFADNFDRFEVVRGEMVPKGQRGYLFNEFVYEEVIKHKTARRLDKIKKARDLEERTIGGDSELAQMVVRNVTQYKEIVFQLDPRFTGSVEAKLREALGSEAAADADLTALVQTFLDMDDAEFDERYRQFYEIIAPHIVLYRTPIGGRLTITAFTRSGYMKSVNVKVYGTFRFKSLEDSALAGSHNLMDLMTFRDLYGYRSEAEREEIAAIKEGVDATTVSRADAEDALFGDDSEMVVESAASGFDEFAGVDMSARRDYSDELEKRVYTKEEIEKGVVLNAAILLEDPDRLAETIAQIEQIADRDGLNIQAVDWQTAAGLIGQFITVIRIVLYVAIFIIFAVALVIINNSMVMATMERVREIGTMRAIGAQRGFILWSLLLESTVQGTIFGTVGVAIGSAIVLTLGTIGIAATSDIMRFLFAGPRLYPFLTVFHLALAFAIMFVVSALSTLYPAFIATRITPLEAMQKDD